jgi:signal transduction histidine kinase/ligand-binding sensor domain-containing protein
VFAFLSSKSRFNFKTKGEILVLIILLCLCRVAAERLPVRVYTTADGLGSGAINSLLYDSRGFLWFATRDGLSRFDGFRFTNYKLGAAETTESFFQIIERRNGDYLAVKQGNGVYRFNAATTVTESSIDESLTLNAEKVFEKNAGKFFEDRDGFLWVIDNGNLSRISEADGKFIVDPPLSLELPSKENISIFSSYEDEARTFWLSTNRGLVRITKDGQVVALYTTPPPTAMRTYLIYLFGDRNGRIWIESQDGFFVLKPEPVDDSNDLRPRPLVENIKNKLPENVGEIVKFTAEDGLRGRVLPDLHQTADGRIWLASDAGLLVFDGVKFRLFNAENGVGEYLTDIAEDTDGNLWLASLSGVYKVVTNGLTTFTKADGLGRADIAAIYQTKTGEIVTAEGDWFVSRFDGEKFVSAQPNLSEKRGAPLWTSNISFLDSHDSWWFLTENNLLRYDSVKKLEDLPRMKPSAVYKSSNEFKNGAFYRQFEDARGDVWTSIRSADPEKMGLNVWRRNENKFYSFGEKENFPPKLSPSAFCEDLQGNLWIGFYHGGLVRFRDGKFTVFTADDGLPAGFVTALFLDHTGKLWIATSESGVHLIEDPAAEKPVFRKIEGISSNNVRALTEDNFGRMYIGTVRGIDRISPDTNQILHFSTADGLADDFVTVAFREQNGTLWFGTRNGLSKFIPDFDKPKRVPPILIAGVRIAGEKQAVSELGAGEVGKLDLKNTQNNLQIDFFSVGSASAEQIRYQFKLEGADQDWSKPTAERAVFYSNLAAGEYRFLVRAVNSQGLASQLPATVVFRIAPPIWKTWWFSALAVLLTFGAIYYLLNQRFKRFLELEKVRTRIATDLHDDIGASLSRISMLSEIVKHQNGLSNPASADRLTQIASDARGLVDSMSDIVWAINPRRDSIESVVDRVCSFAADTLGTKNVHWTVETPPGLKHLHLTAEEKRNLYLIFKEAVNNSARHSECQNASLKIHLERGKLIAEIFDDGVGFLAENQSNGNSRGGRGLGNMQARAAEIGGKLQLETDKNAGTRIILTLPLATYRINGWFSRPGK